MTELTQTDRIDQVVIALDDSGRVRGAHVSKICCIWRGDEIVSSWHETVAFDPAEIDNVLPAAAAIKRALDLEAQIESERAAAAEQISALQHALSVSEGAAQLLQADLEKVRAEIASLTANVDSTDVG